MPVDVNLDDFPVRVEVLVPIWLTNTDTVCIFAITPGTGLHSIFPLRSSDSTAAPLGSSNVTLSPNPQTILDFAA